MVAPAGKPAPVLLSKMRAREVRNRSDSGPITQIDPFPKLFCNALYEQHLWGLISEYCGPGDSNGFAEVLDKRRRVFSDGSKASKNCDGVITAMLGALSKEELGFAFCRALNEGNVRVVGRLVTNQNFAKAALAPDSLSSALRLALKTHDSDAAQRILNAKHHSVRIAPSVILGAFEPLCTSRNMCLDCEGSLEKRARTMISFLNSPYSAEWTPDYLSKGLIWAVKTKRPDVVQSLLSNDQHLARMEVRTIEEAFRSAVVLAFWDGDPDAAKGTEESFTQMMINFLSSRCAAELTPDALGRALEKAVRKKCLGVVQCLLESPYSVKIAPEIFCELFLFAEERTAEAPEYDVIAKRLAPHFTSDDPEHVGMMLKQAVSVGRIGIVQRLAALACLGSIPIEPFRQAFQNAVQTQSPALVEVLANCRRLLNFEDFNQMVATCSGEQGAEKLRVLLASANYAAYVYPAHRLRGLQTAAEKGHVGLAQDLVDGGHLARMSSENLSSALLSARLYGHDAVPILFPQIVNRDPDLHVNETLEWAACFGKSQMVGLLLNTPEYSRHITAEPFCRAFQHAVENKHIDAIQQLLGSECLKRLGREVFCQIFQQTIQAIKAQTVDVGVIESLLQHEFADALLRRNLLKAFCLAAEQGHEPLIQTLIRDRFPLLRNMTADELADVLYPAAFFRRENIVRILVNNPHFAPIAKAALDMVIASAGKNNQQPVGDFARPFRPDD